MILWQQGTDDEGNWICAQGSVHVPTIHWKDTDPPERFEYLARQAEQMAQMEQEQVTQFARQAAIHKVQAEAYRGIAGALRAQNPTPETIIVVGKHD